MNYNTWNIKIDHNFSDKVMAHFSYYPITRNYFESEPTFNSPLAATNYREFGVKMPRFSVDWTISPTVQSQISFTPQQTFSARYSLYKVDSAPNFLATTGLPYPQFNLLTSGGDALYPTFGMGTTDGTKSGGCQWCYFVAANVKMIKGKHTLTMGTELRWETEFNVNGVSLGTYNFDNYATSNPTYTPTGDPDDTNPALAGWSFASWMLGVPYRSYRATAAKDRANNTGYRAFYFQDDIQVTPKLTLNLGLRYDVSLPVWAPTDEYATFDPTVTNPGAGNLPGALVYTGTQGGSCISEGGASLCRRRISDTYWGGWEPRIGFAYRMNDKTVIRGGFGKASIRGGSSTMMDGEIAGNFVQGYARTQEYTSPDNHYSSPTILSPTWDSVTWPAFPTAMTASERTRDFANGQSVPYMQKIDGKLGYIQNWSLTIERKLPWQTVLETSYVGSSSVNIGSNKINLNQTSAEWLSLGNELTMPSSCLAAGTCPNAVAAGVTIPYSTFATTQSIAQALRPYPQYQSISSTTQQGGHSSYHSLQMRAQKYFSSGMTFIVSFTWFKTLADTASQFSTFNSSPLDTANSRNEKRLMDNARTLSIAPTYELPFGPGKKFANVKGPVGKIVGGWTLASVLTYNSAPYLTISGGPDNPIYNGRSMPNRVAGVDPLLYHGGSFDPRTEKYLNVNAYETVGPYALGTAALTYSDVRGWPVFNENISVIKRTTIHESINFEFRAEFFNAFNRVRFSSPNTDITNPDTFGVVSGQDNQARVIQFGLKLNW